MAKPSVSLLGKFAISEAGSDRDRKLGHKEQGLLAILALARGAPVRREELAGLLWSDRDDLHARDSLKHALARLATSFDAASDGLLSDRQTAALNLSAVDVDVDAFLRLCEAKTPEGLGAALDLYRGDLLAGLSVRDPAFENWLETERRRLHALAEAAAERLASHCLGTGDHAGALSSARRWQDLNPFSEAASRNVMLSLAAGSDRPGALREFKRLKDLLESELGVSPELQTLAVHDDIIAGPVREADLAAPPPRPARPSIAVLAFDSLGSAAEQRYVADGIVEDIITGLSRIRWLFVIARMSSFNWRGAAVDLAEIGQALGVRYVLTGSFRRDGTRVRITARLVDATTGALLWAEPFDGTLDDIFELQDQVTARVVGSVAPRLEEAEIERVRSKPTTSHDAYDSYLRGLAALHMWRRDANLDAIRWFGTATHHDPQFAAAYGLEARSYSQQKACGWVTDTSELVEATEKAARRAVDLGQDDAVALSTAGIGLAFVAGRLAIGADLIARSLELNPNLASAWLFSGWVNAWSGNAKTSLDHLARAMRLNPRDPETAMMYGATAYAHFVDGNYEAAARWAEKSSASRPGYLIAWCILAASRALLGDTGGASIAVRQILKSNPAFNISSLLAHYPIVTEVDRNRWRDGLTIAGLPN
jgi:TolB-like protein